MQALSVQATDKAACFFSSCTQLDCADKARRGGMNGRGHQTPPAHRQPCAKGSLTAPQVQECAVHSAQGTSTRSRAVLAMFPTQAPAPASHQGSACLLRAARLLARSVGEQPRHKRPAQRRRPTPSHTSNASKQRLPYTCRPPACAQRGGTAPPQAPCAAPPSHRHTCSGAAPAAAAGGTAAGRCPRPCAWTCREEGVVRAALRMPHTRHR